jgi:hypothetical protein
MVRGIEQFKKHFADFTDRYVLIGGTASTLAMDELGVEFRPTQDLDIFLCIEALDARFVEEFWRFVDLGGYETRQKSTGKRLFYRFHSPKDTTFPKMLELFSRVPDALDIDEGSHLTPIPVGEEVSSLSAILMDDAYYSLIHSRRRVVSGLSIIGAECLIPLKARAYMDLVERKKAGENVDSRDIKKHKNDIFRLYTILDPTDKPLVQSNIKSDLSKAFGQLTKESINLKSLGVTDKTVSDVLMN